MSEKIRVSFFHDVLCAYCAISADRLAQLQREYGDALELTLRPYPLRPEEGRLAGPELARMVRNVKSAAREPDGLGLNPEIWKLPDPPLSSLPPLIAAEAALLQSREAQSALVERLRAGAFRQGINIARRDVIFEIADKVGLHMGRFSAAFDSRATARAVELSHQDAVSHGVRAIPAVAIGEEWLMTGVRDIVEYRETLDRWLSRGGRLSRVLH